MNIFSWILFIFSWVFFIAGFFVVFSCFVGLFKFKDFFIRMHAIKISNIYGISFILLGAGFDSENLLIFCQMLIMIILNVLMTIIVVHAVSRIALSNQIQHAGISRRKYNEIIAEQEKKEMEARIKERIKQQKEKIKKELSGKNKKY